MLFLAPFGKGYGKYWIIAIIILIVIGGVLIFGNNLIADVDAGNITNPAVKILARIIYPAVIFSAWLLNFILAWGVFSCIPVVIIILFGILLWSWVTSRDKRK